MFLEDADHGESELSSPLSGESEMRRLVRMLDWSQTPLGPRVTWSHSLQTAVNICLQSRHPIILFWGPDLVQVYNDAYRPILGTVKHPDALGQRARECWPEIWTVIGPMLTGVLTTGWATWANDLLLLIDRYGYVEECYFTFSYSPVSAEHGGVDGVFCAVTETTERVVGERRLQALRALASVGAEAKTDVEACDSALHVLAQNRADIPFALLYLLDSTGKHADLMGTVGLEPGTSVSPAQVELAAHRAITVTSDKPDGSHTYRETSS